MEPQTAHAHAEILYEPDERPPFALGVRLGFQYTLLIVAGIVLTPVIMIRAAGGGGGVSVMGGVCRAGDLWADHGGPGHTYQTYRCGLYSDHGL